jgi:hypothetical protein
MTYDQWMDLYESQLGDLADCHAAIRETTDNAAIAALKARRDAALAAIQALGPRPEVDE